MNHVFRLNRTMVTMDDQVMMLSITSAIDDDVKLIELLL